MQEILDAITALSSEVGALSASVQSLEQQRVEIATALNMLNSIMSRVEANQRDLQTSIGYLRRDMEHIRQHGCTMRCPPPEGDEPDTAPGMPPLRAVSAHD